MKIPIYQVDAFAAQLFRGNPAAVCPLDAWLPDATMLSIAAENNLAETAFYVKEPDGYRLRWFTPRVEVDLCGHATLATASVIMDVRREVEGNEVRFKSRSGVLRVEREGDKYALDFPSRPPVECGANAAFAAALRAEPTFVLQAADCVGVFETQEQILALKPNMEAIAALDCFAVIVTAPGDDCDFVSRFFAPSKGINEDPVTGRAHTTLTPYWAKRLGKPKLFARQVSERGGELWCEDLGERVKIAGRAVQYLEGTIVVPD